MLCVVMKYVTLTVTSLFPFLFRTGGPNIAIGEAFVFAPEIAKGALQVSFGSEYICSVETLTSLFLCTELIYDSQMSPKKQMKKVVGSDNYDMLINLS